MTTNRTDVTLSTNGDLHMMEIDRDAAAGIGSLLKPGACLRGDEAKS